MLDIQNLLESRYPDFFSRHSRIAHNAARFLGFLFYESRFQQFEKDYPHLEGFDFVDQVLRFFDFTLRLEDKERARIPATGRVVIAANHPLGSLDGLALLNLVRQVRPDVKVIANELLTAVRPLHPVLLPVNNMGGKTARSNLNDIHEHLEQEGALIIFPAGEVSRFGPKGVKDGAWHSGFVKIAARAKAPILPVFVAGKNSLFFYSLSFLARPLSTLWLVREMFKQSHNTIDARVGRPIPYDSYSATGVAHKQLSGLFRKHVYRLARDGRPVFRSVETVAHPENRLLLKREIESCELLATTLDGMKIYTCEMEQAPCVMREIGRLREIAFRSVGEGCGLPRDIDRFDRHYHQLVLWDSSELEIAGAYRLGDAARIMREQGPSGLYTHTLFKFSDDALPMLQQGLELGRSFVQARYQTRHSLDYLWFGIGAFLRNNPRFRYLFGPASISPHYGDEAIARLTYFYGTHYEARNFSITARTPYELSQHKRALLEREFDGTDPEQDFRVLRNYLSEHGLPVPTLYKHYAHSIEPDGISYAAFNIDKDFGHCIDSFVIADLTRLKAKKKKRYLGEDSYHGSTET